MKRSIKRNDQNKTCQYDVKWSQMLLCSDEQCLSVFNDDKKSVIEFKKILNSIHPYIAFTTEMQSNNC